MNSLKVKEIFIKSIRIILSILCMGLIGSMTVVGGSVILRTTIRELTYRTIIRFMEVFITLTGIFSFVFLIILLISKFLLN